MNIPNSLAEQLLVESPAFRAFVLDQLNASPTNKSPLIDEFVVNLARSFPSTHKIQAIKSVRNYVATITDFSISRVAGHPVYVDSGKLSIGLSDAKHLVEQAWQSKL